MILSYVESDEGMSSVFPSSVSGVLFCTHQSRTKGRESVDPLICLTCSCMIASVVVQ